jgi:hypothetical protein
MAPDIIHLLESMSMEIPSRLPVVVGCPRSASSRERASKRERLSW